MQAFSYYAFYVSLTYSLLFIFQQLVKVQNMYIDIDIVSYNSENVKG